jgi:transposase
MREHMKAVPGRKTDVKDREWWAEVVRHGLLKPSFIPPEPIRILRDLTRYRTGQVNLLHAGNQSAPEGAGDRQ